MKDRLLGLIAALGCVLPHLAFAQSKITVELDKPGHRVSPSLWGIFFEDINLSTDGGIYPELVRNRSFEDGTEPEHWKLVCRAPSKSAMAIDASKPLNPFNRRALRVDLEGETALENEGYFGMNIVRGEAYAFKLAARAANGFNGPITVRLLNSAGAELARGEISGFIDTWKYYSLDLTASETDPKAKLQILASGAGTLFLDMVSLLPKRTWKQHGLRPDLAEALDGLKPSFVRFPGGCWVEGDDMAHMYHWKQTIGDIDVRTPLFNIWGYNATHGMGYHEYLQLCEDLGATALFCINVGMSHKETVPLGQMGQWVQDALDAVEYANSPTNTFWGSVRARNGHPAPFNLRYMEIGNENGGSNYLERWPLFYRALKARFPEIQLIANDWQGVPTKPKPDIIDEHYYNKPEFFMRQAHRYDTYDRAGPKVFVGEYAVTQNCGKGNLRAALGEAAFMTGMERNSDIVVMASYAPLFVHVSHRKWNPDLINFDSSRWYGLPSYYVQKLFSDNRGDTTLPTQVQSALPSQDTPHGMIGVGTWNTEAEFKDIKVTGPNGEALFASDFTRGIAGWHFLGGGQWGAHDGVLRQTAQKEFVRALAGDKSWTEYTLELKARKLTGKEGFLILFHINDREDRLWWNIGGWNNTQHALELEELLDPHPGKIEADHWYDIRVAVRSDRIKCWLDGNLVHDIKAPRLSTQNLYASATYDTRQNELILKVVNPTDATAETEINLKTARALSPNGRLFSLHAENAQAENSLEDPLNVAPKIETISGVGPQFRRTFPANSLTILRCKKR